MTDDELKAIEVRLYKYEVTIAKLNEHLRAAREALQIAADRIEGVSIAIEKHGQNITPSFFIVEYKKYATEARQALGKE